MKKILIQAGHGGRTSGATGAPEEQKWTTEIVPKIASKLREHGFEVKEIGADPGANDIAGDWGLFLAVHYDADVYNDRGGFIDTPDPSVDYATKESNRIAEEIRKTYFSTTGIPNHPERSNKNTRFYYMWEKMSANTPCVIIEAGVGFRTEEDHKTLWFSQDKVVEGIVQGILNAFGESTEPTPCQKLEEKIIVLEKQNKILEEGNGKLSEENKRLQKQIDDHVCPITPPEVPTEKGRLNGYTKQFEKDGVLVTENYTIDE